MTGDDPNRTKRAHDFLQRTLPHRAPVSFGAFSCFDDLSLTATLACRAGVGNATTRFHFRGCSANGCLAVGGSFPTYRARSTDDRQDGAHRISAGSATA